jgi:hypothetical protein
VSDVTITLIHKPQRYHCLWARVIIEAATEQLRVPTCKRCRDIAGIIRYGSSKLRFPHATEFLHKFYANLGMRLPMLVQAEKIGSISVCRGAQIYKRRVSETRTHGLHVVFYAVLCTGWQFMGPPILELTPFFRGVERTFKKKYHPNFSSVICLPKSHNLKTLMTKHFRIYCWNKIIPLLAVPNSSKILHYSALPKLSDLACPNSH